MLRTKIIFVGNSLAGDDGIGPYLYKELNDEKQLSIFEMMELGVCGLDMLSYINNCEILIIVDAVHFTKNVGEVILLNDDDIKPSTKLVSQHDLGVEETINLIKQFNSQIEKIRIIGVNVNTTHAFDDKLSSELKNKIPSIKKEVINLILNISKGEL